MYVYIYIYIYIYKIFLTGGMDSEYPSSPQPAKNLLISPHPFRKIPPRVDYHPSDFYSPPPTPLPSPKKNKKSISYSLDTQIVLILILIDVQYSQKAVFSFEKGLNCQNHSSSGSLTPVKFLIPP